MRYPVPTRLDDWVIPEGTVPESVPHDEAACYLKQVLLAWSATATRKLGVARNLAIRFYEDRPQLGIDPDLCLLEPPPPGFDELTSLCLWKKGHVAPPLCIEIVSPSHPNKDYTTLQDRYAAMGAQEVVVFDPLLAGPRAFGGPVPLQVWRSDGLGLLERIHSGAGPAYSEVLGAWFVPLARLLTIANDPGGAGLWQTREERERAEKERKRAEKEQERAEKEQERTRRIELERRIAALEAKG